MSVVVLQPRINTVAMRVALVAFCNAHASLAPFLTCEADLPGGRTVITPDPAGGVALRTIVWKKNLQVVDGPRNAAWCEQQAPNLVWDEIQDDSQELPSQRHKQQVKWIVRGLLTCLGATPNDADDRVMQCVDVLRDIFLGRGAYIGTKEPEHHIIDCSWRGSAWDPIPRSSPLISSRIINLTILAGEQ